MTVRFAFTIGTNSSPSLYSEWVRIRFAPDYSDYWKAVAQLQVSPGYRTFSVRAILSLGSPAPPLEEKRLAQETRVEQARQLLKVPEALSNIDVRVGTDKTRALTRPHPTRGRARTVFICPHHG